MRTVAVNFKGVWNCMKFEIEQMLKQKENVDLGGAKGCIVNTSSEGGITGFPGQAAYIACKHAIIGLTRTASIDYASKGIRINALLPGVIATPMAKDIIKRNPQMEKNLFGIYQRAYLVNPLKLHILLCGCAQNIQAL